MRHVRGDHQDAPLTGRYSPQQRGFEAGMAAHAAAVASGLPGYRDPATGLTVFTSVFLAERGYCCESGCRHCPYEVAPR